MKKIVFLALLLTCFNQVFAQQDTYTAIIQLRPHKDVIVLPYDDRSYDERLAYIQANCMPGYSAHLTSIKGYAPWANDTLMPLLPCYGDMFIPVPQGLKVVAPKGNMPGKDFTVEGEETLLLENFWVAPCVPPKAGLPIITPRVSEYQQIIESGISLKTQRYPHRLYDYVVGDLAYREFAPGGKSCRYSFFSIKGLIPFRYEADPVVKKNNKLYMWKTIRVTVPVEPRTNMPVYSEKDRETDDYLRETYAKQCIDYDAIENMYESFDDYLNRLTAIDTPEAEAQPLKVNFSGGRIQAFCILPKGTKGQLTVCDIQGRLLEKYDLISVYNNVEVASLGSGMVLTLYVDGRQVASQKCTVY